MYEEIIPVVSSEVMAQSDKSTLEHIDISNLVDVVAEKISESYPFKGPVAIVCGNGNNGVDGICLAMVFRKKGIPCHLYMKAFSQNGLWRHKLIDTLPLYIPITYMTAQDHLKGYTEVVDCITGTGCHGNAKYMAASAIHTINEAREKYHSTIISIDLPSGMNANDATGEPVVKADFTIAVQFYKYAHLFGKGPDYCGKILPIDVGISLVGNSYSLIQSGYCKKRIKPRNLNCHKGSFGYISIIGGCEQYSGAIKLANLSQSALRSGCGVARLCVPDCIASSVSNYLLESTLYSLPSKDGFMSFSQEQLSDLLSHSKAIAVGMGWGQGPDHQTILSYLIQHSQIPLLIDADGLNTLSLLDKKILSSSHCPIIITPHFKEMERLTGIPLSDIARTPVAIAENFAKEYSCIVLLKGTTTVITDGRDTLLSSSGCAGMATAGSGDVLSGVIIGMLGYMPANAETVACAAFVTGKAGELAQAEMGEVGMIAGDTTRFIAQAIKDIQA